MPEIATDAPTTHARTIERFFGAIQAGDSATLLEVLAPDAVTRWPQSGEQITGAMACVRIYAEYPGGPPVSRLVRVVGAGDVWTAELVAEYGADRWWIVSICEFDGARIARMTDYFGPTFPVPEWREGLVELDDSAV